MMVRRFFSYFLVAAGLTALGTVGLQVLALRRAARRSEAYHLLVASNVARLVSAILEHEARGIRRASAAIDSHADMDSAALERWRQSLREGTLANAGVAWLDSSGKIVSTCVDPGQLIPRPLIEAHLRRNARAPEITELWRDHAGKPMAALLVPFGKDLERTAAAHFSPAGPNFRRMFGFFAVHRDSRLMLLDGKGFAIFSTCEADLFHKVLPAECLGPDHEPRSIPCRIGPAEPGAGPPRLETTSIAPVLGTRWSVAISEPHEEIFMMAHEVGFTSAVGVVLIVGAFAAIFLLLSRRVLSPLQRLVTMAIQIGGEHQSPAAPVSEGDEFDLVARSLDELGRKAKLVIPPASIPRAASSPAGASSPRYRQVSPEIQDIADRILAGLVKTPPVTAAILVLTGEIELAHARCKAGGANDGAQSLEPEVAQALAAAGRAHAEVAAEQVQELGLPASWVQGTRTFGIRKFHIPASTEGQLWIGTAISASAASRELAAALTLLSTQIQSIFERHALYLRLSQEHEQKDQMLRHMFEVEEEERCRIAREIHDETSQVLCALLLLLESFPGSDRPDDQLRSVERIKVLVQRSLDQTDRLVRRLRPAALEELGLVDAVRTTCQNILGQAGIQVELILTGSPPEGMVLPREVEVAAFRVLQEAITNVVRHSGAARVAVRLELGPDRVRGSLADDGCGLVEPNSGEGNQRPGWGLLGMRERIAQAGGQIRFQNRPAGGLEVSFEIPLPGLSAKRPVSPATPEDENGNTHRHS